MALVTYGDVKTELAEASENGVTAADGRIPARVNAAMRGLMRAMPRGIFVGSTSFLTVPITNGIFSLPAGYDVALAIEANEATQLPSGWIDLLSRSTFVAPEDLIGTGFYDNGTDASGIRSYVVPNLPAGVTSLGVSALRSFVPVTDDTTPLFIQNVEAIRYWLQSLWFYHHGDDEVKGDKYQARAIAELTGELQRHLDDPSRYAERLAQWQFDVRFYPVGTLGNAAARMALDFANGQKLGRVNLYRAVNEASRQATEYYNQFGATERLSNNAGPEAINFVPAYNRADPLSYTDFEVLTLLVKSQGPLLPPETAAQGKDQAAKLIQRNLQTAIVSARNTTWQNLIVSNPVPQFGGLRAQFGLEYGGDGGEDGYRFSDRYVARLTTQALLAAINHQNFLTRTEDYEQDLVSIPTSMPADSYVVPFTFEIIKLFFEGLVCQDRNEKDRANAYKQEGQSLLQRNLVAQVERGRRITAETQVLTGINTFGYTKGRLALELPDGLSMSDAKRGRLINESEELLADSGRWKFFESEYTLSVAADGTVVVPADVETIIAAEQCGQPIELKDRRWFYRGFCAGIGEGRWTGWDLRANNSVGLIYAGTDDCGNTYYNLRNCGGGLLRALCRRKWLPKANESDDLLIQNYPAVKSMVMSLLAKQAGDGGNAEYRKNSALAALDRQLGITEEGQVSMPSVNIAGLPMGGIRGNGSYIRGRFY